MADDANRNPQQPLWAGAHLVTLALRERALLFGQVIDGALAADEPGRAVAEEWQRIPRLAKNVRLDEFVVMPNHIHGILCLAGAAKGKLRRRPGHTGKRGQPSEAALLGAAIAQFKAAATKRIGALCGPGAGPLWQPGYHDVAIQSEQELEAVRRYVRENPARWADDVENPARPLVVAAPADQ